MVHVPRWAAAVAPPLRGTAWDSWVGGADALRCRAGRGATIQVRRAGARRQGQQPAHRPAGCVRGAASPAAAPSRGRVGSRAAALHTQTAAPSLLHGVCASSSSTPPSRPVTMGGAGATRCCKGRRIPNPPSACDTMRQAQVGVLPASGHPGPDALRVLRAGGLGRCARWNHAAPLHAAADRACARRGGDAAENGRRRGREPGVDTRR